VKEAQKKEVKQGILKVNSGGFGFVVSREGPDLFIPRENMDTALDGDTVSAEIMKTRQGKKPLGRIVSVIKREDHILVGTFHPVKGRGIVIPEDDRMKFKLFIPSERLAPKTGRTRAPRKGEVVAARLLSWENSDASPVGQILEVLGNMDDPAIDVKIAARSYGCPLEFPQGVSKETDSLKEINLRKEKKHREDLRSLPCITIDPEDARDFDDALSVTQLSNGMFEVGVHIADVSRYVAEGSAIDREAAKRGTSVYLGTHVIPMLPERLSADLCSLRPGESRPAFSVMMTLNSKGEVCRYRLMETIVRSSCRFTYQQVEDILNGGKHAYAQTVHLLMLLSQALRRKREEKGSIDFDVSEAVFSLDEHGIPYEVRPRERLDAHRLVEEFMLLANRTIASCMRKHSEEARPFIYRVHEKPKTEAMDSFLELLKTLGIDYQVRGALEPEDYRKILDIIENLEFKNFVEKVALQSMTKAYYHTKNLGHFGLAIEAYTHFTSPIRRYSDLIVHRLLKRYASSGEPKHPKKLRGQLEQVCDTANHREVQAVRAEREYMRIKAMQFLAGKVGEAYDGVISGVTSFGLFVELTRYAIEGLVHISELKDDRYAYDREAYQLAGENTGKVFRLGDTVRVKIVSVSVEEQKADFTIWGE